jgi:protein-S-isoprenylcysteine O-methyltransferase Ste14
LSLRKTLFTYRSYTPVPFIVAMAVFARPTLYSMAAGAIVALSGEFLRFWGVAYAGSETRVTGKVGASKLVTSGPFGLVRNPLYVGNILLYVGFGIMSMALFPWLALAALAWFIFQYVLIVQEEESFLRANFGAEYEEYCRHVGRFWPRVFPYRGESAQMPDWPAGWRSEVRTFQAIAVVTLLVCIVWWLRQ